MSWKWVGQTAAVAVATAALTVAVGMPLAGVADAPKSEAVTVAKGTFAECTVELVAGKPVYTAGEMPQLVLKLTSNSSESAEIEATVLIEGTNIALTMSRMAPAPGPASTVALWKHSGKWVLLPGESKEVPLPVNIAAPANQALGFRLLLGPQPVEALSVERAISSALKAAPRVERPPRSARSAK